MSEVSSMQPQHSARDTARDAALAQQEHETVMELEQKQHQAEINRLKVESATKQKVTFGMHTCTVRNTRACDTLKSITVPAKDYKFPVREFKTKTCVHVCVHVYVHVCVHACMCMGVCACVCACVYVHLCVHVYMHVCVCRL